MGNIFQLKFYFIQCGFSFKDIQIRTMTVEDLRYYNAGYPKFVREILSAMVKGEIYNDGSENGNIWYYVPANRITLDGKTVTLRGD